MYRRRSFEDIACPRTLWARALAACHWPTDVTSLSGMRTITRGSTCRGNGPFTDSLLTEDYSMLCVIRHECRNANGPDRWRGLVEGRHQARRYHPSCACLRSGRTRGLAQCAGRAGHPVGGQGAAGAGAGTGCRAARCPRVGAASGSGSRAVTFPPPGSPARFGSPERSLCGSSARRMPGGGGRWWNGIIPGAVRRRRGRCWGIGVLDRLRTLWVHRRHRLSGRRPARQGPGRMDRVAGCREGRQSRSSRQQSPFFAPPRRCGAEPRLACARQGGTVSAGRPGGARHGQRPQVACTCVDETGAGSCRRAANRHLPGMTAARARSGGAKPQCRIFMRSPERGRRQRMAEVPRRPVGTLADSRVDGGDGTGDGEFAYSTHCDGRVRRRPPRVGDAWLGNAGGTIRGMFPNSADQTAGCRPLSNPDVTMRHVLESHVESTVRRCRAHRRVLAVRDTTMPTCSAWPGAPKAWPRPTGGGRGSVGIAAHAMPALVPGGQPLGGAFGRRRLPGEGRKRRDRKPALAGGCRDLRGTGGGLSRHRNGPPRRPRTGHPGHPPRGDTDGPAHRAPCLPVKKTPGAVGNRPAPKPVFPHGGTARTRTRHRRTRRGGRGARAEVPESGAVGPGVAGDGAAPEDRRKRRRAGMPAVRATGTGPEEPEKAPVDWVVLPGAGDATPETAYDVLSIYRDRRATGRRVDTVERGTCIGDRKPGTADGPPTCLAFDAVAARRVHELSRLAREAPNLSLAH